MPGTTRTFIAGALLVTMLAGCAPDSFELLSGENQSPAAPVTDSEAAGGAEETAGEGGEEGGGIISSNGGTVVAEEPGSSDPGSSEGGKPGGSPPEAPPAGWLVYVDEVFGFSISYPDTFVILDENKPLTDLTPSPIHRVRFQTKGLASGPLADREVPQFAFDVFENMEGLSLDQWLDANAPDWTRSKYSLGTLNGFEVSTNLLLAPNTFYYFSDGTRIFKLTPLGQYSEEMLLSFRLEP